MLPPQPSQPKWTDALVVTISEYPASSGAVPKLPGVAVDHKRVVSWLKASVPGISVREFAWPPSAGVTDVWEQLWNSDHVVADMGVLRTKRRWQPGGRLFIYFSGHGRISNHNPALPYVFCASHSKTDSDLFSAINWLGILVSLPLYDEYVVFFDCCNDYVAGQLPAVMDLDFRPRDNPPNVLTVAACGPNERALDTPNGGIFTQVLLEALSGSAGTGSEVVTGRDIIDYLKREVPARAAAYKPGHIQRPNEWMSAAHADLAKFVVGPRKKQAVDFTDILNGRKPETIKLSEATELNFVGSLGGMDGAVIELWPGRYLLESSAESWNLIVDVGTTVAVDGSVETRLVPVVSEPV